MWTKFLSIIFPIIDNCSNLNLFTIFLFELNQMFSWNVYRGILAKSNKTFQLLKFCGCIKSSTTNCLQSLVENSFRLFKWLPVALARLLHSGAMTSTGRSAILEQQIQTQSAVVQFISNTSQHRTNLPGRTAVIIGLASVCWPVLIAGVVCLGGSITWLNPLEAFSTAAVAAKDTWKSHDALWYVKPGWIAMKCLSERKKKKYASWDHFNILRLRSQTCEKNYFFFKTKCQRLVTQKKFAFIPNC